VTNEHNWADNHTFTAHCIHRPRSEDEVRRLVVRTPRIHAIGARHSFNGAADSPGEMIDLGDIDPDIVIDTERRRVTVGAATTYGALAAHLHAHGWALHNMASLPHVSVAGAIATGTHGSGDTAGTLSSAVAALRMVTAGGDLIDIVRGEADFAGLVVALGAAGVVTRVTLDIEPTYQMRQDAFEALPWSAVLGDFTAVTSVAYSVCMLTRWGDETIARLWAKSRLADGAAPTLAHLGAVPAAHPTVLATPESRLRLTPFGEPGPWSERLCHFRPDQPPGPLEQIQSEYMVPRAQAVSALAMLRGIAGRIDPLLYVTEIRTMAGDDLWLSPAHGGDTVAIHFTWLRQPAPVSAISAEIEAMLLPLGGRPHWGKVLHSPADRLAPLYPRMNAFRDLVRRYDPAGKFRNAFLERHVLG